MPACSVPPPPTTASSATAWVRSLAATTARLTATTLLLVATTATPAFAQTGEATLDGIIDRLRLLILGLASGLAALFVTIAGIRLLFGADDPGQVEKGKKGLRSVAIGYAVALLAVSLVSIADYIVGA